MTSGPLRTSLALTRSDFREDKHLKSKLIIKIMITSQFLFINTSCFTDSYISFTLKFEFRQNFCSNRSIGSSTYGKKIFLKFLHPEAIFLKFTFLSSFEENHNFINKNDNLPAWRKIRNIFITICAWPNGPVRAKILPRF